MAQQTGQQSPYSSGSNQFVNQPTSAGLPWRLMIFSLLLFLFSILLYAGLRFGYQPYLNTQVEQTDQQIEGLLSEVSQGEQEQLLIFHSQLINLENVLSEKAFSQNLFTFLEDNTLPLVYYTELEYLYRDYAVDISGRANSVRTFVQQSYLFDNSSEVQRTIVNSLSIEGGQVVFSIRLFFLPEFFESIN